MHFWFSIVILRTTKTTLRQLLIYEQVVFLKCVHKYRSENEGKHQLWIRAPGWTQDCPKLGRLHTAWFEGLPTWYWLGGQWPGSCQDTHCTLGGRDPSWSPGSAPITCSAQSLSHVQLCVTAWTVALQPPLSTGFSRQEYWNGLPFAPPGDRPTPGIEPVSPALQEDSLQLSH